MANVTLAMALGWICRFLMIGCLWMAGWPPAVALSAGITNPRYAALVVECLSPGYFALTLQSLSMVMISLLLAAWSDHKPTLGVESGRHRRLVPFHGQTDQLRPLP